MTKYPLAIIVAMADNNAIGKNGKLLIYLPKDLKWFKKQTLNHTVIMGRKTFETLPNGALPQRKNIVLTKNKNYNADNVTIINNFGEIWKELATDEFNFVIGGAEIYKLFLPYAQKLFITRIHQSFEADSFFPEIDFSQWNLIEKIENKKDDKNPVDFDFLIYERKTS